MRTLLMWSLAAAIGAGAAAEEPPLDGRDGRQLLLDRFQPRSKLKVGEHPLAKAKFPVVDVHVHPRIRLHHAPQELKDFVGVMDRQNVAVCVSLDGGMGDAFDEHVAYLWTNYRDRFLIFANVDWRGQGKADDPATWDCQRPDFARRMAKELARLKGLGASGLKVFKDFGLRYRNADGSLIKVDDPRWDPIWHACGELGLPVIMHTADPAAFFEPIDETNERWEELHRHPDWSFFGPQWPTRGELHDARNRIIKRHPGTTFIGAHLANDGEDLAEAGRWLDEYPNLVLEIASRINELGRQPYTARDFFVRYADRILFGTDGPRSPDRLVSYWRFLETRDEYFAYAETPFPPQGFWRIYGIDLPDDVLKKVYSENAARIIPGVKERLARR
ncbi:MAG TPA: amidohydrolase family protein [Pirellulales bacterium]|nr:amidohydrolase family protein [Pirellulales bacterium]